MEYIDLRSDTVSHPSEEMRRAMAEAVVGDDVYGEDPTVKRLQEYAADLFGQEAGLFVSSGTQGNLIAMLVHARRGDEVILGDKSHIFLYEQGGIAALGGIMPHTVPVQKDGTLALTDIARAVRVDNIHFPRTRAIALENTQGTVGGVPLAPEYVRSVADFAHAKGLKLHIDGARIFNAATHFDVAPATLMAGADSLTFCLSKGLCAPAGSLLVGSRDFIEEARRVRKVLGGGMRQIGILAAAGLVALEQMSTRLWQDHEHAAYLGERLQQIEHLSLLSQHTNFTFFRLAESAPLTPQQLCAALAKEGILLRPYHGDERNFRAVLHYWIGREQVDLVVAKIRKLLCA